MRAVPHLPSPVEQELRRIGAGIRTARLRRNMSQEELAERMGVSFHTIRALEQGKASTAFGHYVHALWTVGLMETLGQVADPALDREGMALDAGRQHASGRRGRSISNEF